MAHYLGLTIETVSRQITRLKAQGTISLIDNRHFQVPDIEALDGAAQRILIDDEEERGETEDWQNKD